MKVAIMDTYYQLYLKYYYDNHYRQVSNYDDHLESLLSQRFGTSDSYSYWLGHYGFEAIDFIVNDPFLQNRWAAENSLIVSSITKSELEKIFYYQILSLKPDLIYVQDIYWPSKSLLTEFRSNGIMIVGQHNSPVSVLSDLFEYDTIFTGLPPLKYFFQGNGIKSEILHLAFDDRFVMQSDRNNFINNKVSFIGGVGPLHLDRVELLNYIANNHSCVDYWGYGFNDLPVDSPARHAYRGQAWGGNMFKKLSESLVTLNCHGKINVKGYDQYAINMRLFEASGSAVCLLTESKRNIPLLFEPETEIVTYSNKEDALDKLLFLSKNPQFCLDLGYKAQLKALKYHTYRVRMLQLIDLLHGIKSGEHFLSNSTIHPLNQSRIQSFLLVIDLTSDCVHRSHLEPLLAGLTALHGIDKVVIFGQELFLRCPDNPIFMNWKLRDVLKFFEELEELLDYAHFVCSIIFLDSNEVDHKYDFLAVINLLKDKQISVKLVG